MNPVAAVRWAVVADLDAIMDIGQQASTAPQWSRNAYRKMLSGQDDASALRRVTFVAETGSEIVGFAVVTTLAATPYAEAELESIAVAEAWRGRGFGRQLLQSAATWVRQQGAQQLRLEVRAGNTAARLLYERAGFVQTALRRRYYAHPEEDAVCLSLALSFDS